MKKNAYHIIWILVMQAFLFACTEEDPQLSSGEVPEAAEAEFTYAYDPTNPNIINFSSTSTSESVFLKKWDLGNGQKPDGDSPKGTYPRKGTYTVTLTVYTAAGSVSTSQTVSIANTNPLMLDVPLYNKLTGGISAIEGKTWAIDSTVAMHMGLGPLDKDWPEWWPAPANAKANKGLYNDRYTFKLDGFTFNHETKGDVYVRHNQIDLFPGGVIDDIDYKAPYNAPTGLQWDIAEETGKKPVLTISGGLGFLGLYTGVQSYRIDSISENVLWLRYLNNKEESAWYLKLKYVGATTPPPPPPPTFTVLYDFEGTAPAFVGFGGGVDTQYSVVDNPSASGINTTAKVAKLVKGIPNWSGISIVRSSAFDFSTKEKIKMKVYSPVTGRALFKLEVASSGGSTFIERFADITKTNEWEELTFDFSGVGSTYDKVAIFMDFDNNNGGTFHIDDIIQSE